MPKGRAWTTREENYLIENAGILTVAEIAADIGRSERAVTMRAHHLREKGRLNSSLVVYKDDDYISYLETCLECMTPRTRLNREGICRVCVSQRILENHKAKMYRAYENLPPQVRDNTTGIFTPTRAPYLMTKSANLERPKRPSIDGLDAFDASAIMDAYYEAMEEYELAKLRLDIDAVKQRTSKWRKKTRAFFSKR